MRIFIVIGTRPEAINMLPLARELRKFKELEVKICFSSQHTEMAKSVFEEFGAYPDFELKEMKKGICLTEMTVEFLNYFDMIYKKEEPDLVLVHGDTTTAFCASLAAFYLKIKVGHIEAGLRTFDTLSPFPEEFNRVSIDAVSNIYFAPTENAAENLRREGRKSVFTVGNTVIDALEYSLLHEKSSPVSNDLNGRKLLVITTHRRENLGEKMRTSLLGIRDILSERKDLLAVMPAHLNPAVRDIAFEAFTGIKNIKICEPLPMRRFHILLSNSYAVFTDSGGIQEEAAYLGIPVFLMRENTERPEGVDTGNVCVVGCERERIKSEFLSFMGDNERQKIMRTRSFAFGDGHTSERIAQILIDYVNTESKI